MVVRVNFVLISVAGGDEDHHLDVEEYIAVANNGYRRDGLGRAQR